MFQAGRHEQRDPVPATSSLLPWEGPREPVTQSRPCSMGSKGNSGCSSTAVPLCAVGAPAAL